MNKKLYALNSQQMGCWMIPKVIRMIALLLCCCASISGAKNLNKAAATSVNVNVMTIKPQVWQPTLSISGSLQAKQGTILKAEAEGQITSIYVNSGQDVKNGQILLQINPGVLTGQLKSNQAALALQQVTFERYQKLFVGKAVSKEDLDTAKANYLKAQGDLEQTQAQIAKTLIKAPFDGTLGILKVNLGDYVTVGQAIISLQNTNPIYADFAVPEKMITQLHVNDNIAVQTDMAGKSSYQGKILAMDASLDPTTRSLMVRAAVANPSHLLLPGMFVIIKVDTASSQNVISIPQTAVQYAPEGSFVYKVIAGKAIKTKLTLGSRQNDQIIVLKGLAIGDTIITAGQQKLQDGSEVKVIP